MRIVNVTRRDGELPKKWNSRFNVEARFVSISIDGCFSMHHPDSKKGSNSPDSPELPIRRIVVVKNFDPEPRLYRGGSREIFVVCICYESIWGFILICDLNYKGGKVLSCAWHVLETILSIWHWHISWNIGAIGLFGVGVVVRHIYWSELQRKRRTGRAEGANVPAGEEIIGTSHKMIDCFRTTLMASQRNLDQDNSRIYQLDTSSKFEDG